MTAQQPGPELARAYQIKITLQGIRPAIWRRVLVPADATLVGLHRIIQAAMGWEDYHLWRFEIGEEEYGEELDDDWMDDRGMEQESARDARLEEVARPGDVLVYEYDFGDSWEHRIRVEKALPAAPASVYPVCVAGEFACPPEDCGGVLGYAELLEALGDPDHPEHASMLEWVGGNFDPAEVDFEEINHRLRYTRPRASEGGWGKPGAADRRAAQTSRPAGGSPFDDVRSMADEILRRTLAENPGATMEDLNAALEKVTADYNRRPHPEFGGLSPTEVTRLLEADWQSPGSAVRLETSMTLEELEPSPLLHNARLFLDLLGERGTAKATPKGNLPRAFVDAFRARMRFPPGRHASFEEEYLAARRVVNEEDLRSLHVLRIVLDLAGLVKKRKGEFSLTRTGEQLAADARAGELCATLFKTHFRTLNLAYLDGVGPVPGCQQTLAYTLYRFGQVEEWRTPGELAGEIVLPAVQSEVPPADGFDRLTLILETRFLRPMAAFGLAEMQVREAEPGEWDRRVACRKAPLFDRFLRFKLAARE